MRNSDLSVHGLCLFVGTLLRGSVREQVAHAGPPGRGAGD